MHNSLGYSFIKAGMGKLVNNLQNTQRKKTLQFFQKQPSKSEPATQCVHKITAQAESTTSCSINNQNMDWGRSMSSQDCHCFISKMRIILLAIFIS